MLVIAIIVSFIAGIWIGWTGIRLYVLHASGMSMDEIEEAGNMLYKASTNRTSTLTLCTEDGGSDVMIFEK